MCVSCAAGSFSTALAVTSSSNCTSCAAGTYSLGAAPACTACSSGLYSTSVGANASSTCVPFKPCVLGGYNLTACPLGYFCPAGSTAPTPCTVTGSYCPVGSSSQVSCPGGSYCVTPSNRTVCSSSTYCPPGSTAPINCTSGVLCPSNSSAPTPCTAGGYCPERSSAPTPCPAGAYCPAGSSAPLNCTERSFCPSNSSTPLLCTAGGYCPARSVAPTLCPVATYCPSGSLVPLNCTAGGFCPANSSAPTVCTAGGYCPARSVTPLACPASSYCPVGSSAPLNCTVGGYCPVNSSSPLNCTAGGYCPAQSSAPLNCTAGGYCPMGSFAPLNCTPGGYCPAGSSSPLNCTLGSYCPLNSASPKECSLGSFCPERSILPSACLEHFYCPTPSEQSACPIDYYCPTGSTSYTPCNLVLNTDALGTADADVAYEVRARTGGALSSSVVTVASSVATNLTNASCISTWQVPAKICSMTMVRVEGVDTLVVAFCNVSFLVRTRLEPFLGACSVNSTELDPENKWFPPDITQGTVSNETLDGFQVLIGDDQAGFADGFQTQAAFQSELHVTSFPGSHPGSVFVLDRFNCLLREVVVNVSVPYLTRVYTVYGLASHLETTGAPRCYGAGSLSWPRAWFPLPEAGMAAFVTDAALMQFNPALRDVAQVLPAGEFPPGLDQDSVTDVVASDLLLSLTLFSSRATFTYAPASDPCPGGYTSPTGGDCALSCAAGSYVDADTGECRACSGNLACLLGEQRVACTSFADGYCRPCPPVANVTVEGKVYARGYVTPGDCESPQAVVFFAPCPPDYYGPPGGVCAPCGAYSGTDFDAAETADQCRCWEGNFTRRADGACVGGRMYPIAPANPCPSALEYMSTVGCVSCAVDTCPPCGTGQYATPGCVCADCLKPANASFLSPGMVFNLPTSCRWGCRVGFYPSSLVATLASRCRACTGIPSHAVATTAGAADAPAGCEWECLPGYTQVATGCV